ncbi:MAG: LysR family transcriptional regulator [Lachnospiraceae bacterium]|nr:LysR family transcriptional regulator [Lachnospiraceae bacterium]
MSVTYDYYRIFYYVAKYKNFTQAANALMSNQPNVSRAISNLESELGCRLFVRSNRGVTLTPEGQRLYGRVAIAHRQLKAAEQELSEAKSLQNGIVTIGVSEASLHVFLLPRLKKFHALYPSIRIQLSSVTTPQAIGALKSGFADLAIVTTPTGISRPLKELPLMQFREILVAGPRFAHLAEKPFFLKDLQRYPLIMLNSQTNTREFYNQYFVTHGLSFLPDIEASSIDQMLPMIKYDLGIGFLPDIFAKDAIEKKEIFEIKTDFAIPWRSVCLVRDTGRLPSIAARELEKILQQA